MNLKRFFSLAGTGFEGAFDALPKVLQVQSMLLNKQMNHYFKMKVVKTQKTVTHDWDEVA